MYQSGYHYPHPSLTLLGSPSSIPEVTSRIICTWPAGFVFSGITKLYISSLAFISCGHNDGAAVKMRLLGNCSIVNCSFENNVNWLRENRSSGEGGVLHTDNSILSLTGTTFYNNYAYLGGALSAANSILTLTKNTFQNNTAGFGGAFYVHTNSTLVLTENTFQNNIAENGGALFVHTNSSLTLTDNTFHKNSADNIGGAIVLLQNSTLTLTKNILQNNLVDGSGGVLYVGRNSNITLTENAFQINLAVVGGALYIHQDSNVILTKNTFQNNSAEDGGALYIYQDSNLILTENIFENNLAEDGGALYIYQDSNLILTENIFENNLAEDGGALYIHQDSNLILTENIFENNLAVEGGALCIDRDSTLTLTMNQFQKNSANENGGAITVTQNCTLTLTKNIFQNNSVGGIGGAVYVDRNSNITLTENVVLNNLAYAGGTLYIHQDSNLILTKNIFQNNLAVEGGALCIDHDSTLTLTMNQFQNNSAEEGGALFVDRDSKLILTNNIFQNNSANINGGAITVTHNSTLTLRKNIFQNNLADGIGGAVYVGRNNSIALTENTLQNNLAKCGGILYIEYDDSTFILTSKNLWVKTNSTYMFTHVFENNSCIIDFIGGGALYILENNILSLTKNTFRNNLAEGAGGAVYILKNNILSLTGNTFQNNLAEVYGGALIVGGGNILILTNNSFQNNLATECVLCVQVNNTITHEKNIDRGGGVIYVVENNTLVLTNNTFQDNSADHGGGAFYVRKSNILSLTRNTFQNNSARTTAGGALYVSVNNTLILTQNIFLNNSAYYGGAVLVYSNNTLTLIGNFFQSNSAVNGGGLYTYQSIVYITNDTFAKNTAQLFGGTIYCITNSNISIYGNYRVWNNTAQYGGGMAAVNCRITVAGNISFEDNNATYGGGLYADGLDVHLSGCTNFINNSARIDGGGVYASRSIFTNEHRANFLGNSAFNNGGGMMLTRGSKLYFQSNAHINFTDNLAMKKGGALMVEDSISLSSCTEMLCNMITVADCFFQIQTQNEYDTESVISEITELYNIRIHFKNNSALEVGATLYGSSIDNCSLTFINQHLPNYFTPYECSVSGQVFDYITSGDSLDISSDPLYICTCKDGKTDCSSSIISMAVYPGGTVNVPVIAYGQRNGTTPAVIHNITPKDKVTFNDLENTQNTTTTCTILKYTVQTRAVETFQEMKLYADGPCPPREKTLFNSTPDNILTVYLKILQCPPGFELSEDLQACECEQRLKKLTDECKIDDKTIKRDNEIWVGYVDDGNSKGLILHSHCPFDYCSSNAMYVAVDDSDKQCSNNRSGLLCGKCTQSFSLAFGNSHCLQCSDNHLWLLAVFAVAGLAFVFLIFVLNLTVAAGTINGLVFYGNVLAVNSAIFFQPQTANILTVFIAWINLDLGIETCFYDGMDTYAKTWLQFVFPLYVWALVIGIITVSHYSIRISTILSNSTIAVLATLILLSYTKLLRTIIAALSYTVLEYPNNSQIAVWLYDGNIRYLSTKHIPLFIAALVCLIFLFIPYTMVLLFGQWIRKSKLKVFSLINNYRILFFQEAYHAPYTSKHRYWTGLILITRCYLFLVFAFNVFGDPSINLLCIGSATAVLLILTALLGNRVYKTLFLNILELSFNSNLCIIAMATLYVRSAGGNQNAVTFTSISVAFVTFVGIVIYHLVQQLKEAPRWWRRIHPSHSDNYNPVTQTTAGSQPQGRALPSPVDPSGSQFATVAYININDIVRAQLEESVYGDTSL